LIAREYDQKKQTRSELSRKVYEIRAAEKILLAIEALERGEIPVKADAKVERNQKLKELESALVKLAEEVVNADGRKEFSLCISKDGGVEDYGEAAWVHCQLGTVYVCVPRNHAVADARHYYGQGMVKKGKRVERFRRTRRPPDGRGRTA